MKNISKTKARHGASWASYCLEKGDNKGQRAINTKECEAKWNEIANETTGQHKEMQLEKQKNVGVNSMEIAALNKRGSAGKGLELVRQQQEVNRKTKQSR